MAHRAHRVPRRAARAGRRHLGLPARQGGRGRPAVAGRARLSVRPRPRRDRGLEPDRGRPGQGGPGVVGRPGQRSSGPARAGCRRTPWRPSRRTSPAAWTTLYASSTRGRSSSTTPRSMQPRGLVQGPDRNAYFIDGDSRAVWRVETRTGAGRAGDPGRGRARGPASACRASSRPAARTSSSSTTPATPGAGGARTCRIALLRKPDEPVLGDDALAMEALRHRARTRTSTTCTSSTRPKAQIVQLHARSSAAAASRTWATTWPPTTRTCPASATCSWTRACTRSARTGMVRHYGGRVQDFELADAAGRRRHAPGPRLPVRGGAGRPVLRLRREVEPRDRLRAGLPAPTSSSG